MAPEAIKTSFIVHFSELQDPRRINKGNLHHILSDILLLAMSAMLCGIGDWLLNRMFMKKQQEKKVLSKQNLYYQLVAYS